MDIEDARKWASAVPGKIEERFLYSGDYRGQLIECARLAVAKHEYAENWEGYAKALLERAEKERARSSELAEERNRALEEAARLAAVVEELRRTYDGEPARPGSWWCAICESELESDEVDAQTGEHIGCSTTGTVCRFYPASCDGNQQAADPAPVGSVWEYTEGVCKGHRYRKEADGYRYINPDGGHCPRLDSAFDPPTDPKFRRVDDQPRPEPAAQHCAQPTSAGAAAWEERLRISRWLDGNGGGLIASLIRGGEHWREEGDG